MIHLKCFERRTVLSDELRRAYVLKEAYRKWFNEAKKREMEGILQTKKELLAFYKQVEVEGIPEFIRTLSSSSNFGFGGGYSSPKEITSLKTTNRNNVVTTRLRIFFIINPPYMINLLLYMLFAMFK